MSSSVRDSETLIYRATIAFVLLVWTAHVVCLPIEITYDGLGYIDGADVLGSSRFPTDWYRNRVPLFPLSLKIAFWILGRTATTAIVVSSGYALAGILLLGATVKRLAGRLAGAAAMAMVSVSPTLITYGHCVLTETGSFFFISLTLYLLLWTPERLGLRTAALALALGAGYYIRQNLLTLTPVIAVLHGLTGWPRWTVSLREFWQSRRISAGKPAFFAALHVLAVAVIPFALARPWTPYEFTSASFRDTTLRQGMLHQALLPPDDSFALPFREDYNNAIRLSIYKGNFLSGMRYNFLTDMADKIWSRDAPKPIPQFFLDLVVHNPGRYLSGVGRTLIFFAGAEAAESDNRIFRDLVLSESVRGSKISPGPEPLRTNIQRDFTQQAKPLAPIQLVRVLIPLYDPLQIAAGMVTVLGLAAALWLCDLRLLAFCLIPCAYALGYALFLASYDRYIVPVYPVLLANAILVPLAVYRRVAAPRGSALG